MALRNMIVRVGANTQGLRTGMADAKKQVTDFSKTVRDTLGGLKGELAGIFAGITGFDFLKQGIDDAQKYESNMAGMTEMLGTSITKFQQWQDGVGKAMGYSKLQSSDLAKTLALNFKGMATSTDDLVNKTTKMMEAAAVISNKRGMSMTEVSDRIRSAMNQEADGADELGINVRAAAISQSKAYKEMANGKPWADLNSNVQKAILYQTILDQVSSNLGTTIQDTTALRMSVFTASLGDVRLALGQAFLPILYVVLPLLTTLMNWMYKVLEVFAAFMSALFGSFKFGQGGAKTSLAQADATQKQANAVTNLGNAQNKATKAHQSATKAAQGSVAAFDEVNTLAQKSATGAGAGAGAGGGGGAGAGIPTPTTPTMPKPDLSGFTNAVNSLAENLKTALEPLKHIAKSIWDEISGYFKLKVAEMTAWWNANCSVISQAFGVVWSVLKPVIIMIASFVWDSIKGLCDGIIKFFQGISEFFSGIMTHNWKKVFQGLSDMIVGAFLIVWNWMNLSFIGGLKKIFLSFFSKDAIKILLDLVKSFSVNFDAITANIVGKFVDAFLSVRKFFKDFGQWLYDDGVVIAHNVIGAFEKIGEVGKTIWSHIQMAFWDVAGWFLRSVITPVVNSFDQIKDAFNKGLGSGLKAVFDLIRTPINDMIDALNGFGGALGIPWKIKPLPYLAKGGLAMGPTLAVVGEGSRPEAIAPIDKLQSYIATAVTSAMRVSGGGGSGTGGDIILNIDGRQFARIIKPILDKEAQRVGQNIRLNPV